MAPSGWLPLGIGFVLLFAGLYQFWNPKLRLLRDLGHIDPETSSNDVMEGEGLLAKVAGVVLILVSLFFFLLAYFGFVY